MNKIAHVVVGLPVEGPFDYLVGESLQNRIQVGQRVCISFHGKKKVGYVVSLGKKSFIKSLKPILSILDEQSVLDTKLLKLTQDFAQYYGCSWGEAIETSLPTRLRRSQPIDFPFIQESIDMGSSPKISGEATLVLDQGQTKRWPYLMETIRATLDQGQGVIFLVPEIFLIDKVISQLKKQITHPVAILDKQLKPKEELQYWMSLKAGQVRWVIGTRSAVFAPIPNLKLIIIYEEENSAYKQEQSPSYHVREVAHLRIQLEGLHIMYISSAPSAELWWLVKKKKVKLVSLEKERLSEMQLIDMANYKPRASTISFPLQSHMQRTLTARGKIVLFLNRRGFSTMTRCNQCGFTIKCPRCEVNLTYSYATKLLVCRLCNYQTQLPKICPQCHSSYLRFLGSGVERIESEVARIFPQAKVTRYDRESSAIPREADIIIATQAILRILDQLSVDLMGVLNIDGELSRYDFRSAQKTFSLLVHLRQMVKEKMIVQTFHPDNYCLKAAVKMDYEKFYQNELSLRKELGFPPFRHLVAMGARGTQEETVLNQVNAIYSLLKEQTPKDIELLDPHPDSLPKLRDRYRFNIMAKGKSLKSMLALIKRVLKEYKKKSGVIVTVNVDP